jgi:hypothetical protein
MNYTVSNSVISKDTIQDMHAGKLQSSMAKFARSMALRPVQVNVKRYQHDYMPDAPAWSDDHTIHIAHDKDTGNIGSADNIIRLKGLLIHELSHVLFTPRSKTALVKWVRDNRLWNAFNILEDNRIENLMVANMSGVKPWLVHTVTTELIKTAPIQANSLLPLVWGRKYLPLEIRMAALDTWRVLNADDITALLDEYITLNLQHKPDILRATVIIGKFSSALQEEQDLDGKPPVGSIHHGTTSETAPDSKADSQPMSKAQQDKLLDKVEDDSTQPSSDDSDESSASSESGASTSSGKTLAEQLQDAADAAMDTLLEDVKSTVQSVKESSEPVNVMGDDSVSSRESDQLINRVPEYSKKLETPSADALIASRQFAKELTELRTQHDPGWMRRSDQGRLNVKDFMLGTDLEEAFDQWSEGNQDVTDIECVVLLDNSGSMEDMITPAYEAMWAVKRGLDSVQASTTVIQYGSRGEILYGPNQRASNQVLTARHAGSSGGTDPFWSLKKAHEILADSTRAIKMMIVITDGSWGSALACEEAILAMRGNGVLTGLVFLADPNPSTQWQYSKTAENEIIVDAHKCEVAVMLTAPRQLVDFAKDITKLSQKRVERV